MEKNDASPPQHRSLMMFGEKAFTPDRPLRLVNISIARGSGGGIPRMDTFYHRFIDRKMFHPVFVICGVEDPDDRPFDPSIEYVYTGAGNRLERLVKIFVEADIVQFAGGFAPIICEAAKIAQVPTLVEVMHLCEPGQLYPQIDVTICVSETVRRYQPEPDKTAVILNGVDVDQFAFRREPSAEDKFIILESARREKPKHFHLDDLADDLLCVDPGIELWLAGRGQEGESTDRVKFLGLRDDIVELYRKADMMALFSVVEPFGLSAIEAMACGSPPLASNDGGMAEIITDGVDGWLVNGADRPAIVRAVRRAVAMRKTPQWEETRRAARATVETRFNAKDCVAEYEKIYIRFVNKKGRRTGSSHLSITPTPETILDEAAVFFNQNDWDGVEESAKALAAVPEPITIPLLANMAAMLAAQAVARGKLEIAEMIYSSLFRSRFRDAQWLKSWIAITRDPAARREAARALNETSPADLEGIMLWVETLLADGEHAQALAVLREGARLNPQADDVRELYDLLRAKLGIAE
jgi:glycosyltransferase involved in cell wall biosynthesis